MPQEAETIAAKEKDALRSYILLASFGVQLVFFAIIALSDKFEFFWEGIALQIQLIGINLILLAIIAIIFPIIYNKRHNQQEAFHSVILRKTPKSQLYAAGFLALLFVGSVVCLLGYFWVLNHETPSQRRIMGDLEAFMLESDFEELHNKIKDRKADASVVYKSRQKFDEYLEKAIKNLDSGKEKIYFDIIIHPNDNSRADSLGLVMASVVTRRWEKLIIATATSDDSYKPLRKISISFYDQRNRHILDQKKIREKVSLFQQHIRDHLMHEFGIYYTR